MKGYSLHIGVNNADPEHYPGLNPLNAAVNDAKWWEAYAAKAGYETTALHDEQAKIDVVKSKLKEFAGKMVAGDILLLTYSGHGGEIENEKPDDIDKEKMDQTWCLYDEEMLDDELYECFRLFKKGTRITVVADSCHSGTIIRDAEDTRIDLSKKLDDGMCLAKDARGIINRHVPEDVQSRIIKKNKETLRRQDR